MKFIPRLFRHLLTTKGTAGRTFPPETLKAIEAAIATGEQRHRAEVRLVIEHSLPMDAVFARVDPRQRAIALFSQLRIWDTEENCGVLVYINIADRKVEIVADRDVSRRVTQEEWNAVCRTMTEGFKRGEFRDSAAAAMQKLNALLEKHYPTEGAHPNQLPNQPIML